MCALLTEAPLSTSDMLSTLMRAAVVLAGLAVLQSSSVEARRTFTKAELRARQEEAVRNLSPQLRAESGSGGPGTGKNITFTNPRASGELLSYERSSLIFMARQISTSTARPSRLLIGMLAPAGPVCCPLATERMRRDRCVGRTYSRRRSGLNYRRPFRSTYQLFFWFFPPGPEGSLDDLIFWYASAQSVSGFGLMS